MKRSRAVVSVAVAAALCVAGAVAWRAVNGPAAQAYAVQRTDILQSLVASGRVESPRRVEIASAVTGTVASVPVGEGESVKAGQLLVALDPSEAAAAVDQARSAVAQGEAHLAQLRATSLPVAVEAVRQAEVNLANAERALARSKDLHAQGFVGQAALDEAQRGRDVAASQLKSAQLQRDDNSPGGSASRLAVTALAQARASLAAAKARLDLMTLEAPLAGMLISRDVEVGNVAQPGKTLMTLSPAGETQLVVQIDEKNLGLLAVGQKALASADAYPGRRFDAQVVYINPGVDPTRGSVEAKLAVRAPPAYLLQDMTVSVDIEVARRAGVLTLPTDAVRAGDVVMVVRGGHAVRQAVKLGARGDQKVEIVDGVAEGELVLPATNGAIHEGAAVRAKRAERGP